MSVELLQIISTTSFVVAVVLLLVSIILFFYFDIKKIIGELSGSTERKAINDIRYQTENSSDNQLRRNIKISDEGKLTDKITPSGRLLAKGNAHGYSTKTEKFNTEELSFNFDNSISNETTVLYENIDNISAETTVLSSNLSYAAETTLLTNSEIHQHIQREDLDSEKSEDDDSFIIDIEMGFTDSEEIIE